MSRAFGARAVQGEILRLFARLKKSRRQPAFSLWRRLTRTATVTPRPVTPRAASHCFMPSRSAMILHRHATANVAMLFLIVHAPGHLGKLGPTFSVLACNECLNCLSMCARKSGAAARRAITSRGSPAFESSDDLLRPVLMEARTVAWRCACRRKTAPTRLRANFALSKSSAERKPTVETVILIAREIEK